METNNTYLVMMSDILDSGVWARLSPAAKALYPVLCKFSNLAFKPVWPGTEVLLRLTGFKTKKSLQEAKKELVREGLLHIVPGTGRTPTHYYFRFSYPGSRVDIEKHRESLLSPRGRDKEPPGDENNIPQGAKRDTPNHISIHINKLTQTTHNNNPDVLSLLNEFFGRDRKRGDFREQLVQEMLEKYGTLEVGEAVKIAISRGKDGDIRYLEGILKNRGQKRQERDDGFDFSMLPPELKIWQEHLHPIGRFGTTWYFATNSNLSASFVEEQFRRAGYKIRVVRKPEKREEDDAPPRAGWS
ncbi:MAG: helix-turn-helix domain-containing protein [Turneriella sp.]|nr:helix-turn-helix domain-containing protein [Leptospiraceae bacterium]MCX7632274.1 helix-turn-helix domain-containing protein [Turneriella sp.]